MSRARLAFLTFIATSLPAMGDPAAWTGEGWRTDFTRNDGDLSSIRSGGPPRDGIPSIDQPEFRPVAEVDDLQDREPVIGLAINGQARAYPLRILMWHEIVNDTIDDAPVAVTYCPLCNAAIVFSRTVEGLNLDFGTTGKLRNSDLVMYDRQTETWWQQFTGRAIAGEMLGRSLEMVPSRLESWAEFKTREPAGMVLVPSDPSLRPYGRNPYVGYDRLARPFLYDGPLPSGIAPMARVVIVELADGKPLVLTLEGLRAKGAYRQDGVELRWAAGQASALDQDEVAAGQDVGTVTALRLNADGLGVPMVYHVTFAFVAKAFHPEAEIVSP